MIVPNPSKRGTFIVLEGVDRCGKTTQCGLLLKHLVSLGVAAVAMRFPDRTTLVGQLIDGYLASTENLDDRAVHLLFSANRWEAAPKLSQTLAAGTCVVCDRYAYSGVAFSSAKVADPPLTVEWCQSPDVGLPAPDAVIFLDLSQEEAEQRGGSVISFLSSLQEAMPLRTCSYLQLSS
jgi:dTMP kinase